MKELPSDYISQNSGEDTIDRRGFLKCMAWAGTGLIWSVNGGILTSTVLAQAANNPAQIATAGLNFVQISDSHIGFNKPANTDVVGTTREAIMRINALPKPPEFLLHTGDLTHLTEPEQFDTLAQLLKECRTKDVFYVPGEHDFYDNGEKYRERFGKDTAGAGWHSFDQKGVHFTGLVNVANIQEGGLGTLGQEQLDWLEKDVKSLSTSTPIVLFAHIPLWAVYPQWGWGTDDPDVVGTLKLAVAKIKALPKKPDPIIHTGDLSHLSEPEEFDTLSEVLKDTGVSDIFYVPGEHDVISDNGAQYRERFGKGSQGTGWYSMDHKGVHFIGLVNVVGIPEGGLGVLGTDQLTWLEKDLSGLSASTPIVVLRTCRFGRFIQSGGGEQMMVLRRYQC
jgi:3',5'-cyclic-AMP phosphodiesterase